MTDSLQWKSYQNDEHYRNRIQEYPLTVNFID